MSKRVLPYLFIGLGMGMGGFAAGRLWDLDSTKACEEVELRVSETQRVARPRLPSVTPARPKESVRERQEPDRIAYTQALTDLRTSCWEPANKGSVPYAGEPVAKFSVYVTVNEEHRTPFEFCVDELVLDNRAVQWRKHGVALAEDNAPGVAGGWFVFSDAETQWTRPPGGRSFRDQVADNAPVCIKGIAPLVRDGDWGRYWGAAVSFGFASPNKAPPERELVTPRFSSVTVVLSGAAIPRGLRFTLDNDNGQGNPSTSWCMMLE